MPKLVSELGLRPLGNRIVIKRLDANSLSKGGLHIPDNAQEKQTRGVVVVVGRGRWLDSGKLVEPEVSAGQTVLFPKYGGIDIQHDGQDYVIVNGDEILAVDEATK